MPYTQGYHPKNNGPQQTQAKRKPAAKKKQPPARARKRTKRRRSPLRTFLVLALFAMVATLGIVAYMVYEEVGEVERKGTFYRGVYVDGVPLYGASPQQAYDYLVGRAREDIKDWHITLQYGENQWRIDTDTLGMRGAIEYVVQEEVNKAFFVGRSGGLLERYQDIMDLRETPYHGYTSGVEKNTSRIDSIISEIQSAVYRAPQNATSVFDFTRKNDPVVVTAETYGQQLNAEALREQIIAMVNNMEAGTIAVNPEAIAPDVTADMLRGRIVLLGAYESKISSRSTNERNLNIERGLHSFQGLVVEPGQRVSFNKLVGERTERNGFYPAEEIVSGSYEMGIGGGICQVSSALYNAVIHANLKVRDRTNHGIPVNYMELGADATVSDGRIDFVFENDTGERIYILARLESGSKGKSVVFQIYGRPDPNGYKYHLRHETLEEIPVPEPNRIQDKNAQHAVYDDEEVEVFKGAKGYIVRTYLVVTDASGSFVSEKVLYTDTYKAQTPRVYVGVTPRATF